MKVTVTINGVRESREIDDRMLLSDFIRDELGLKGTNVGCSHGVCGSCTIHLDGRAVRSCTTLAVAADGAEIGTVEGIAASATELHPLQAAFQKCHALQCGFCTPGFLMSALPALERREPIGPDEARELISGNICRCTGYDGIVAAIVESSELLAAEEVR